MLSIGDTWAQLLGALGLRSVRRDRCRNSNHPHRFRDSGRRAINLIQKVGRAFILDSHTFYLQCSISSRSRGRALSPLRISGVARPPSPDCHRLPRCTSLHPKRHRREATLMRAHAVRCPRFRNPALTPHHAHCLKRGRAWPAGPRERLTSYGRRQSLPTSRPPSSSAPPPRGPPASTHWRPHSSKSRGTRPT